MTAADGRGGAGPGPVLTDDRGRPCPLAPLTGRELSWRPLGVPAMRAPERVRREERATIVGEVLFALVGCAMGVRIMDAAGPMIGAALGPVPALVAWFVGPVLAALLVWRLALGSLRLGRAGRIGRLYLAEGLCPSCGYPLAGLPSAGDGCVECPECAAAWRADRLGPAAEIAG